MRKLKSNAGRPKIGAVGLMKQGNWVTVLVDGPMREEVERLAQSRYQGNRSMAVRYLIQMGLAGHREIEDMLSSRKIGVIPASAAKGFHERERAMSLRRVSGRVDRKPSPEPKPKPKAATKKEARKASKKQPAKPAAAGKTAKKKPESRKAAKTAKAK